MQPDPDICYRAHRARDARFDGRFFTAVDSTRIYCRPVCTAPLPKRENCRFYASAAAAEQAGYRPCLRCRPELAPGLASVDASARLARAAASLIDDGALTDANLASLAACKHAFDLNCRPDEVLAVLGDLAQARPGLRLPGAFDAFELGVRAILGQQVTVQAARTLARRLVQRFGASIETPFAGLDRL
jgi:3-methyladenine DNA glycosylase/8-oxoguanine DNA glycosylase